MVIGRINSGSEDHVDIYGVFPLPETNSYTETETDECTDISGKMGTVPNGIGLWTCIGLGICSVETVLHITIEAISIGLCLGLSIGIGLGQWKCNGNAPLSLSVLYRFPGYLKMG